jgi:hypothetical protein
MSELSKQFEDYQSVFGAVNVLKDVCYQISGMMDGLQQFSQAGIISEQQKQHGI